MKERINYVDYAKGIAMILMISGHCSIGGLIDKFTTPFRIPFFFIVSGFLYSNTNTTLKNIVISKAKILLIPYFVFGLFHIALYEIMISLGKKYIDCSPIYCLLINNSWGSMPIHGIQWFLTAFFFASIFFISIHKLNTEIKYTIFISLVFTLIGSLYIFISNFRLPLSLGAGLVAVGLMEIGYWLKKYWHILSNLTFPYIVFILIAYCILVLINGSTNMRSENYNIFLIFLINATIGSYILLWAMNKLDKCKIEGLTTICKILKYELSYIGKNSIIYMCMNEIIIILLYKLISILTHIVEVKPIASNIINWILSLCILHFISFIFNKRPLSFSLGRFT